VRAGLPRLLDLLGEVLMPEASRDAAILQGDLSRIQLPDVLSFIAMIRATGKLTLRNGQLNRTIVWKDGEIVFANSNSPEHSLGQFLLRNGKITNAQYEESKRRVTAQTRHGKVLVQMGAISPNLITVAPSREGIVEGLAVAAARAGDLQARLDGAAVSWSRDWEQSFNDDVMRRILALLEDC